MFFARADYQDTIVRALNKSTEWLWSPSPSLGAAGSTLGVLLPDFYYPPDDMNFGDDGVAAIVDDPALENFNLAGRVDAFVADALTYAAFTPGDDQICALLGTAALLMTAERHAPRACIHIHRWPLYAHGVCATPLCLSSFA